jgi:phosphoenolpyruvate synthase/pyruvate phosphate dikinase
VSYIEWFKDGEVRKEIVGGKGGSLAHLAAEGFPVPTGFTLTTEAYRHFFEASGLGEDADEEQVRERFQTTALPADIVSAIDGAYAELAAASGLASAVRSSAPSEDGGARSSAGLYESYLNVQGIENVLDAVKRCYLSLWSARALHYRGRGDEPSGPESMAVVIMSLVPAETAGVAFTAHPVTGDRDVVLINSSWGLGEAVVSGMVTPDSFTVAKPDFTIVERDVCEKPAAIRPQSGGTGTAEVTLDRDQKNAPSLTDEQVVAVARLACHVEEHFGQPQDIEWALTASTLHLLQARPITTLS